MDCSDRREYLELDVGQVSSIEELHCVLASGLAFPSFYGKNWSAFWDAITGLVQLPRRLIIRGWRNVASRWPDDAYKMSECLHDLNAQFPSFACEFELQW